MQACSNHVSETKQQVLREISTHVCL